MPDPEKDSAAVQQFFANMEAAFRAHSLWSGCSEEELESAGEVSSTLFFAIYTICSPTCSPVAIPYILPAQYSLTGIGEVCHDKIIYSCFRFIS